MKTMIITLDEKDIEDAIAQYVADKIRELDCPEEVEGIMYAPYIWDMVMGDEITWPIELEFI